MIAQLRDVSTCAGDATGHRSPIHRIVVGVDGSDAAARALDWAIGVARPLDAEVVAVHAYEMPPYVPRPGGVSLLELELCERVAREDFELDWCAPLAAAGVRHRAVFVVGAAVDVLLRVADAVAADLVVTGSNGHSGLFEALRGSVSRHVAHRAHRPVVVVPAGAAARDAARVGARATA
jgi:nucleotide-binding universal stress UspA family protein